MQKSIRQDLSIKISCVIFCISIIVGIVYYLFSIHYYDKELKSAIEHQTNHIANTFTAQLWLFDLNTTKELCKLLLESPEISGLRLLDHKKKVVFEQAPSHKKTIVHVNRSLRHKSGKLVGYVDIFYTDAFWEQERTSIIIIGILMMIGTMLGAFLSINILLKRYLSRPLEDLQKDMVSLAKGDFQQSGLVGQKTEIQNIIDTFNKLAISLREKDQEVISKTEALRESEDKYRSMMEAMIEPIYICSSDFRVEYMNPAMIRRTGRDAVGERCFKALYDLNEKCPWRLLYKTQQGEIFELNTVNPKDDRSYHISCMPIINADGSVSTMAIFRDTTDFIKLQTQLQHAEKMEAIGILAGGVAHDLNNILGGLVSYPELLLLELPDDSPLREFILTIQRSGQKAAAVVQDMLTLARRGVVAAEVVNLNEAIDEYLKSPELQNLQSYPPPRSHRDPSCNRRSQYLRIYPSIFPRPS
ncbi:MAG: PAS domain-containing protein [Deltaproteobacteria bacterium]|nr:PAS domain-containing protein [Deltaproteobacteria bacterium]